MANWTAGGTQKAEKQKATTTSPAANGSGATPTQLAVPADAAKPATSAPPVVPSTPFVPTQDGAGTPTTPSLAALSALTKSAVLWQAQPGRPAEAPTLAKTAALTKAAVLGQAATAPTTLVKPTAAPARGKAGAATVIVAGTPRVSATPPAAKAAQPATAKAPAKAEGSGAPGKSAKTSAKSSKAGRRMGRGRVTGLVALPAVGLVLLLNGASDQNLLEQQTNDDQGNDPASAASGPLPPADGGLYTVPSGLGSEVGSTDLAGAATGSGDDEVPGTTITLTAKDSQIPARVLAAYQSAAQALATALPSCHLKWEVLAGIGKVESGHARARTVASDGTVTPVILGPRLNGQHGYALIRDTDDGQYDQDTVYDRAVGPMQFIPSTWKTSGRDGNHDGVKNPNNVDDAALAAAYYLCAGGRDLATTAGLQAAIYSYNPSDDYVRAVLAWVAGYSGTTPVTVSLPTTTRNSPAADDTLPLIDLSPEETASAPAGAGATAGVGAGASPTPTPGSTSTPSGSSLYIPVVVTVVSDDAAQPGSCSPIRLDSVTSAGGALLTTSPTPTASPLATTSLTGAVIQPVGGARTLQVSGTYSKVGSTSATSLTVHAVGSSGGVTFASSDITIPATPTGLPVLLAALDLRTTTASSVTVTLTAAVAGCDATPLATLVVSGLNGSVVAPLQPVEPTPTPTGSPTPSPSPTASDSPEPTPSPTASDTPSAAASETQTATPTAATTTADPTEPVTTEPASPTPSDVATTQTVELTSASPSASDTATASESPSTPADSASPEPETTA